MTPYEVEQSPVLQDLVLKKFTDKYFKTKRQKEKFEVGDHVRILLYRGKFSRSYNISRSYERFRIKKVVSHKIPQYILEDEKGREIEGFFHAHELVRVQLTTYRSNVIAQKKDKKGGRWLKLSYKGYPSEFDSGWIRAKDLEWEPI